MSHKTKIKDLQARPSTPPLNEQIIVVKMGGSFLEHEEGHAAFIEDIYHLYREGAKVVIVHGGGKEINARLEKIGIVPEFKEGYRVTDSATMEEVEMTLSGKINKDLSLKLNQKGAKAIGISGKDGMLLKVRKKWLLKENRIHDIGLVGEIVSVEPEILNILLSQNYIPVISPVGFDESGKTYNINADLAASAIAGALKSAKLMLMTDVKGLYLKYPDETSLMHQMSLSECEHFLNNGDDHKGMKPKVESAIEAIKQGTKSVHILNGSEPHSLTYALTTDQRIGTIIS